MNLSIFSTALALLVKVCTETNVETRLTLLGQILVEQNAFKSVLFRVIEISGVVRFEAKAGRNLTKILDEPAINQFLRSESDFVSKEHEDDHYCGIRTKIDNVFIVAIFETQRSSPEEVTILCKEVSAILSIIASERSESALVSYDKRQEFWRTVLSVTASTPKGTIRDLCTAWKTATGADWVWLWLNSKVNYLESLHEPLKQMEEWQLLGMAPTNDFCPKVLTMSSTNNVAEYCLNTRSVVYVSNIGKWENAFDGKVYKVHSLDSLQQLECTSFDCVPLLPPIVEAGFERNSFLPMSLRGAICIHYRNDSKRVSMPPSSLLLMGRLTALALINTFHAEQRDMLVQLNALAETFLTSLGRPRELRAKYLTTIRQLIKEKLTVEAVSLFYRDPRNTKIECLISTGLKGPKSENIDVNNVSSATYDVNEGFTGRCFSNSEYFILPKERREPTFPKYVDTIDGMHDPNAPTLFYPLPRPSSRELGPALGVVRCTGRNSDFMAGHVQTFNAIDLQLLDFIVRQITPVLETMATNIERERTVSIIKHDLLFPSRMIQDVAEEIEYKVTNLKPINPYRLKDLRTSALLITNLVMQLDPAPAEIKSINPQEIRIGPDIVAPIKSMLLHYAEREKEMNIIFGDFQSVPPLKVDKELISRALMNLVMNAIKYGDRKSDIKVLPSRTESGFFVSVINYGMGITDDEIPQLFNFHYRSRRAILRASGIGLGLAISKAAMEAHGGSLTLTQPKDPTIFSLFFPKKLVVL